MTFFRKTEEKKKNPKVMYEFQRTLNGQGNLEKEE